MTLVEVVAALAILAMLGAVAVRALRPTGATLSAEVAMLKSQLRYVQAMAMAGGSGPRWGLSIASDRYWLVRDGAMPNDIRLPGCASAERRFPTGVRVSSGALLVGFDAWGSPGDADLSVTLTDGGSSQVVVVTAATGFVR